MPKEEMLKQPVESEHNYCWCCQCPSCQEAEEERRRGDLERVLVDLQYALTGWEQMRST